MRPATTSDNNITLIPMFEGLDDIDWASLTHAYGSAEDVPGLLRARASRDTAVAEEADGEFFGNIWHQGTVYQATAHAVPFLVELLRTPQTHDRAGLIMLLACIAEGASYMEVHAPHVPSMVDRPELKNRLAQELEWKAQARQAVGAWADDYWKLIDDPAVHIAVPYLLAQLPGETSRFCAAAIHLIGSKGDPLFDASVLFAWAVCEKPDTGKAESFLPWLHPQFQPLTQLGGALGVLRFGGDADVDDALRVYFDALQQPAVYEPNDRRWFWGKGELFSMEIDWLSKFGPAAREALRQWLPAMLPRLENYQASCVASEMLSLAFDAESLPSGKSQLRGLQFALLQALSRFTNILHSDPLIRNIMQTLGLPNDMKRLKAFLE